MLTEPVQKLGMDSGGEKCQTPFFLQLLSCPVLDGYNYYLGFDSGNKLKGGGWKPSVFQGLEIQTAAQKRKTGQRGGRAQALRTWEMDMTNA